MTTPRSGLKPPSSRIGKPGGIPRPGNLNSQTVRVEDAVAQSARVVGMKPSEAGAYADNLVKAVPSTNSSNSSTPKDNFIIGERVLVSGNKRGYIQFLGETQFAPGQWAGVVLEDPVGKNDGSVNGVRYFQCESKRGVFARPDKLSRESATGSASLASAVAGHGLSRPTGLPSAPRMGTRVASPRGSVIKLPPQANKISSLKEDTDNANTGLKGGDRVIVSGTKLGTLRYIGTTEFAKGDWAGVELDDELGKNDGAVAGTRYFQCQPKHGLFAPIHKVAKVQGKPPPRPPSNPDVVTREKRSSSTSSLSSVGSTASSLSRGMAHPDLVSPRIQETPTRRVSAGPSQLEKRNGFGFKAENSHVHGRGEDIPNETGAIAATTQSPYRERGSDSGQRKKSLESAHHLEHELAVAKAQHEQYMRESEENLDSLRTLVESADRDKVGLLQQLEEERRKLEDLQFRLEEANINSTDLKAEQKEESGRVRTLKERLVEENQRATKLQQEVDTLQGNFEEKDFKIAELETESATYQEQIEFLQKENQNALQLVAKQEYGKLVQKQREEMLTQRDLEIAEMQEKMTAMGKDRRGQEEDLGQLKEQINQGLLKHQQSSKTIEDLQSQLSDKESTLKGLASSVQDLKNTCADLERKCIASVDRCSQLVQDKQKLEADITQIMKSSGDSSDQLVHLNEQLRSKERRVEELMSELSEANQMVAKLHETLTQNEEAAERESKTISERHRQQMDKYQMEIHSLQASVDAGQAKLAQQEETHHSETQDLTTTHKTRLTEVREASERQKEELERLQAAEATLRSSLKETEHKLEKITTDKTKLESNLEQVTKDRDKLKEDLDQSLTEKQQLLLAKAELSLRHDESSGKYKQLQEQLEKDIQSTGELQQTLEEGRANLEKVSQERDTALRERTEALAQAQEMTIKFESQTTERAEELKRQGIAHQEQLAKLTEGAAATEEQNRQLRLQLETSNQNLEGIKSQKSDLESARSELQRRLEESQVHRTNLGRQSSQEMDEVTTNLERLKLEKESLLKETKTALQEKESLLQEREALRHEKETVLADKDSAVAENESAVAEKESALREKELALQEKESALREKAKTEEEKNSIALENKRIIDDKERAASEAREANQQRALLEVESEGLRRQVETYKQQLDSVKLVSQEGQNNMGSLQAQLAEARCEADARQHKTEQLQAEATRLKEELKILQTENKAKLQLEADNSKIVRELQELKDRFEADTTSYEAERDSVQDALDVTNALVSEKERLIEQLNREVVGLKGELTLSVSYKNSVERLEDDKAKLEDRANDLQTALRLAQQQQETPAGRPASRDFDVDGDPILDKLQEEREMAEGQVTFLNSVIVDLQRKNDELRARLEIMEDGGMNGAHNDLSLDDMDMELSNRMPPPRMFCDICDVFDLHDTEDCPLQSSSDSPPATQYHGTRHDDRPYCEICEVFGHWTENCDDEQTY